MITPYQPSEYEIQEQICQWAAWQHPDTVLAAIPNSSPYAQILIDAVGKKKAIEIISRIVKRLKRIGLCPGFTDLIWLYSNNRSALFEVKSKGGKIEDSQKELHPKIRRLGHEVHIVRSLEDFQVVVKRLLGEAL